MQWHDVPVPDVLPCLLFSFRHGYNFVVVIPAGASNIDIRQRGYKGLISDDNYLALKNAQGKYLLNGHFIVSAVERDLMVKGSVLRYSGTGTAVESLQAFKPIQEPLTLEVLSVGKMTPPRVRYSFYLPKESKEDKSSYKKEGKSPPDLNNSVLSLSNRLDGGRPSYKRPSYKWAVGGWEACSVTCGDGLQKRSVVPFILLVLWQCPAPHCLQVSSQRWPGKGKSTAAALQSLKWGCSHCTPSCPSEEDLTCRTGAV